MGIIRGAGKVLQARLERDGLKLIGQLQEMDPRELVDRYGSTGLWLSRVAQAIDSRAVDPGGEMKTISSETTFNSDLSRLADLEAVLWAAGPSGCRPVPRATALRRPHGSAEAEDQQFQIADPQRLAGGADPVWPTAFSAPPRRL